MTPPDEKKCPCEAVINIAKDVRAHDERLHRGDVTLAEVNVKLENIEKRFDKFEEKIDKQFKDSSDKIETQFKELSTKIQTIELQPAKRWDGLVTTGIAAVVGAIVSAIAVILGGA